VIAGGSIGAALGGAITGFFAERVGTPNLLVLSAVIILVFGAALPFVWDGGAPRRLDPKGVRTARKPADDLGTLFRNPHVRLIAASVLLMVVVKQLVDYQFNALTLEVFQTRDAVSAFQGKFNAATQWLPLVVVLALRPLMARWGVGAAVFLLPGAMLVASLGLSVTWSLWAAVGAKASDSAFRYSAERAGREVLYVPLPEEIKLRAKGYIDVAIEKGLGKVLSAGLIFLLLLVLDHRQIAYVTAGLSLLWLLASSSIQREYIRALARSIERRSASLRDGFASLDDASTRTVVQRALSGDDLLQAAFALDLLDQAAGDVRPFAADLYRLLDHPSAEIRIRTLATLARSPELVDPERVRARLRDADPLVRQAAVRLLCTARPREREAILTGLLGSPERDVRTAALMCLALGEVSSEGVRLLRGPALEEARETADREARVELALAAGALPGTDPSHGRILQSLMVDPDPAVASAALRSAARSRDPSFHRPMIAALACPATRTAARDALAEQGAAVVGPLSAALLDTATDPAVRRSIPSVLARVPAQAAVQALLESFLAPETDQLLDFRTLKALGKLRARHPELAFDSALVLRAIEREIAAAGLYTRTRAELDGRGASGPGAALLRRALLEGWRERREGVFRCLGLLYPPVDTYRCYLAVVGGGRVQRANALEWLENRISRSLYSRVSSMLEPEDAPPGAGAGPGALLPRLWSDDDAWIARCALWTAAELHLPQLREALLRPGALPNGELARLADRLVAGVGHPTTHRGAMDLIEKVFLLQQIDLLHGARSAHLALLASIAEEVEAEPDTLLVRQGEPTDALYVVTRGVVELRGLGEQFLVASAGMSFGTWALIDEAASLVEARTVQHAHLLRISREDFYDLLADHPELSLGLLQGLARRVRTLVA
jgi:ATP:ADP antiporter, AAA family